MKIVFLKKKAETPKVNKKLQLKNYDKIYLWK